MPDAASPAEIARRALTAHLAAQPHAELLARYAARRDPDAFAGLVHQFGPLVLGACRRVLGPSPDADDAFQATFLALARQAASFRDAAALPAWLHRVALRTAHKAAARRPGGPATPPDPVDPADPLAGVAWRDVRRVLDEEIDALPEKYRGPVVLCLLDGLTQDEAAGKLGVSLNTLKRRLGAGRDRLRSRLARRGLAPALAAAAVLNPAGLRSGVPAPLALSAVERGLPGAAVPPAVGALAVTSRVAAPARRYLAAGLVAVAAGVVVMGAVALRTNRATPPGDSAARDPVAPRPAPAEAPARDPGLASTFEGKASRVNAIAYHPDGMAVAAGGQWEPFEDPQGLVEVYDGQTGRVTARFDHPHPVASLAYHPDGKTLATVCSGGTEGVLHFWDLASGKRRSRSLSLPGVELSRVAYRPDGKAIAVVGYRYSSMPGESHPFVQIRDADTLELFGTPANNFGSIQALAFSPDGKFLAVGGNPWVGLAEVWDIARNKVVYTAAGMAHVGAVAFHPHGEILAIAGYGSTRVVNLNTKKTTEIPTAPGTTGSFVSLAFSPDGTVLACGHSNRAQLVEVKTLAVTATLRFPYEGFSLAFRPDGRALAVGGMLRRGKSPFGPTDGAVWVWDLGTGRDSTAWAHTARYEGLAFGPDGKTLLTFGRNADAADGNGLRVEVWEVATRRRTSSVPLKHLSELKDFPQWNPASRLAFRPDGKAVDADGWLIDPAGAKKLPAFTFPWRDKDGKPERAIPVEPIGLSFSPNGKLIAGVAYGRGVCLWDGATHEPVATLESPDAEGTAWPVVFGPDNKTVAVGRIDSILYPKEQSVELWDVAARKLLGRFTWPMNRLGLSSLAFSPDGKTLAVGGSTGSSGRVEGVVELWDLADGKGRLRDTLRAPGYVARVAFSPDGSFLAGAINPPDRFLQIVKKGEKNPEYPHNALILWDAKTGKVLADVPHNEQVRSVAFSPDGQLIATASSYPGLRLWAVADLLRQGERK